MFYYFVVVVTIQQRKTSEGKMKSKFAIQLTEQSKNDIIAQVVAGVL